MRDSPHEILQVSPNAELHVITAAYHSLAKKYHPDKTADPENSARMAKINWAYEVLCNSSRDNHNTQFAGYPTGGASADPHQSQSRKHSASETGTSSSIAHDVCHRCQINEPIKYIETYPDLGLFLISYNKNWHGNLCKECILDVFWKMVTVSSIPGYWNPISIVIVPLTKLGYLIQRLIGLLPKQWNDTEQLFSRRIYLGALFTYLGTIIFFLIIIFSIIRNN